MLQVGDCAESFFDGAPRATRARLALIERLACDMEGEIGRPVMRIARMGGQFAKPRSTDFEHTPAGSLPVFRGHLVNSEVPAGTARRHDPRRMLRGYAASARVAAEVCRAADRTPPPGSGAASRRSVWLAHEALVLDYELAMLREAAVVPYLASTHLPWVGERTRRLDGAHIELLSRVRNPVMCKVGAGTSEAEVEALARRLNPGAIPGRLTLIPRMGAIDVVRRLPPLVAAVKRTGIPVVWVCDPMHGNTRRLRDGRKARLVTDVCAEVAGFVAVLGASGIQPGGLHLEVALDDAGECLDEYDSQPRRLSGREPALCDPRLSPLQARTVIGEFAAQMRHTRMPAARASAAA